MRETPVDLYRMGNAGSPRLENVRAKDIEIYIEGDESWVAANSGGISTFSSRGSGKNWWKLDRGTEIPNQLRVVNDYGHHWLWEPSYSMPLDVYKEALRFVGKRFDRVS
ncbi:MAG: hypothetical protein KME17_18015 [Cyanosarcina radialis HA8281-LM2]|jgi:hypothetical protein|nr:hypothetical protein [Cyanosarcina radialis HA8281-LM2]